MSERIRTSGLRTPRAVRLPLQWRKTRDAGRYLVMRWQVAWPATIGWASAVDACVNVLTLLGDNEEARGTCRAIHPSSGVSVQGVLELAARRAAIRFQEMASPALASWISSLTKDDTIEGLAYPFLDDVFAQRAGLAAIELVSTLAGASESSKEGRRQHAATLIESVQAKLKQQYPRDQPMRILAEAWKRGLPFFRVSEQLPVYQIGHGVRQRRMWRGFTASTSHIATVLSTNKALTNELLRAHGFPVPEQHVVSSLPTAEVVAKRMGWPVVVKPANTDYGTAVTADIRDLAVLRSAYGLARRYGAVIIERHVEGVMHRCGVINGKCLWVARTMAPACVADGRHSVKELAGLLNDARRRDAALQGFAGVNVHDPQVLDTLVRQGLRIGDVPPAGTTIVFRPHANVSTGATREIVTPQVHPDNLKLAERAAAVVGLDIAGIDFICTDITRPWLEVGGGICEVNPTPGMPDAEAPGWVLDYLFPEGTSSRVPIVVVVGDVEFSRALHARLIDTVRAVGHVVGAVVDGAACIDGRPVSRSASLERLSRFIFADATVAVVLIDLSIEQMGSGAISLDRYELAITCARNDTQQIAVEALPEILNVADDVLHMPTLDVALARTLQLLQ